MKSHLVITKNHNGFRNQNLKISNCAIHSNSIVVQAKALYFALGEERDNAGCFLAFQEIKESPKNKNKLVIDL